MPMGGMIVTGRPFAIPWTAVNAWARRHDLSMAEMVFLDRCIVAMDILFLARWKRKMEEKSK